MRIISWNVNGLRANIRNKGTDWVINQSADAICLQEIKVRPDQLSADNLKVFDGYRIFWNPAERPGYSGVATLSSVKPLDVQYGLDDPDFDGEGRLIITKFQSFVLMNIYFPNGRRDHSRVDYKLGFYAKLLELCDRLHHGGEQIILCGDFNTSHQEIDLRNPKSNINTTGFLPSERAWLDRYIDHGFVDIFRKLYPNSVKYTWWTYRYDARGRNIGWRLDYFFISESLMPNIRDTTIHDEVVGSDHCPISIVVDE